MLVSAGSDGSVLLANYQTGFHRKRKMVRPPSFDFGHDTVGLANISVIAAHVVPSIV